ncbi:hypothetical protein [Pseudomonas syringae]|uniref:Uncharacterized protein n=1 Tax=Pseudomonas syringae TaxID=317 RepID=A0A085V7B8_PSESX|nr:hypothetical protein [Pseudomonas syringae]KFE51331.1 hypothetical protein IV01_24060 [Pseudomonas syringae]
MSFERVTNFQSDHTARIAGMNEMQREDFLALAAALRQFNAYEPQVCMAIANAQSGGERYSAVAAE